MVHGRLVLSYLLLKVCENPGLVVLGEEGRSIGLEFVSRHHILDGSSFVVKLYC